MSKKESVSKSHNKTNIQDHFFLSKMLDKIDLQNKRVFLRADLNVPIETEMDATTSTQINYSQANYSQANKKTPKILSTYKLEAILPTINLLLQKGAKIILATHIGNPKTQVAGNMAQENTDPGLSTKILLDFFKKHNYKIAFEPDISQASSKNQENTETNPNANSTDNTDCQILLLENLRFFAGEQDQKYAQEFTTKLHETADYFVNDAFGVMHRQDSSVTILPTLFDKNKIFLGLLVEKEIFMLNKLANKPKSGFTVVIGGNKVESKLKLLEKMLDKIDNLLLCPAINFPFMKYFDQNIGKSLFNESTLPHASKIIEDAKKNNVNIFYPIDFIIAKDNFNGPLYDEDKPEILNNFVGIAIGPKTAKIYADVIKSSKTVFFNGISGNVKREESLDSAKAIFKAMNKKGIFSVIGGGDSVASANLLCDTKLEHAKLEKTKPGKTKNCDMQNIDHLSTGGGASLAFLGTEKLPGLIVFEG